MMQSTLGAKIPESNPQSLLTSRIISNNLLLNEKQHMLNTSILSDNPNRARQAKNVKSKLNNNIMSNNHNGNGNTSHNNQRHSPSKIQHQSIRTNINTTQAQMIRNKKAKCCCYSVLLNCLYSKTIVLFYSINILISISLMSTSILFLLVMRLNVEYGIVIIILCIIVIGMNAVELLAKAYAYDCKWFVKKHKADSLLNIGVVAIGLISFGVINMLGGDYNALINGFTIAFGLVSSAKSSYSILHHYQMKKSESAMRKNVEEIIQFQLTNGDNSDRKNNKGSQFKQKGSYYPHNDIN